MFRDGHGHHAKAGYTGGWSDPVVESKHGCSYPKDGVFFDWSVIIPANSSVKAPQPSHMISEKTGAVEGSQECSSPALPARSGATL